MIGVFLVSEILLLLLRHGHIVAIYKCVLVIIYSLKIKRFF